MAGEWHIETNESREAVDAFLKASEPWRMLITFSNGARTDAFKTFEPFNKIPLNKLRRIENELPPEAFSGRVLDIGFNAGYNSITVASRYGASAVGIDVAPKHKTVAEYLAGMNGVSSRTTFLLESAETYCEPGAFDLVLHLGTLYHLPNPVLSMQTAARNLRPGGWFALESEAYIGQGGDHDLARFIYGWRGDNTNWWALSKKTISTLLTLFGLTDIRQIWEISTGTPEQARVMFVARKA
jgi:SAM-dependent methyltransferase